MSMIPASVVDDSCITECINPVLKCLAVLVKSLCVCFLDTELCLIHSGMINLNIFLQYLRHCADRRRDREWPFQTSDEFLTDFGGDAVVMHLTRFEHVV